MVQLQFLGKDLFAFRFGCLVFWDVTSPQLQAARERLRAFMVNPLEDVEEEKMEFIVEGGGGGGGNSGIDDATGGGGDSFPPGDSEAEVSVVRQDQIILTTSSPLERLAHSYALAQSVRLGVFEIAVDRSIANTRSIPETMAATGEVKLEARDLSRKMGQLLVLRCDVNLHTDILDTPEIFWDEERFEPHYEACRAYLDVDKRVEILNQRMGVLKDLYDLLQEGMNVKHESKLEWIIIILILVEVVLELSELLLDTWSHS